MSTTVTKNGSPTSPGDKLFVLLAAWLVPGLGHVLQGRKRLGWLLCGILTTAFIVGFALSGFTAVSRDLNPWSFFAQVGFGGAALPILLIDPAAKYVLSGADIVELPQLVPSLADTGVLFCNIAGLLNLLIVLDVADRLIDKKAAA